MADLRGGVGASRANNGSRTTSGPIPVAQPATNHDVRPRTPKQVLKDREERMARRRREELEEQERVSAERRAARAAAGGATGEVPEATSRSRYPERPDQGGQASQATAQGFASRAPRVEPPTGARTGVGPASSRIPTQPARNQGTQQRTRAISQPEQPRPVQSQAPRAASNTYTQQPQTSQTRLDTSNQAGTTRAQAEPSASSQRPAGSTQQGTTQTRSGTTSSFPHAFERWETLSSHWEGLTGFWIKRLEGNSAELRDQPLNQQLARQVTDLSAAGANLFHAVVELQRLRASSERKFQRWFFETREEHEKNQERIAQLEAELNEARRNRTTDQPSTRVNEEVHEQARQEAQRVAEEQIAKIRRETELEVREKNRELEISKEEARRGWEEIGRMEQENRDRTFSLRRGEPTIVGGVQVVPFIPAGAGRQTSTSRGHAGGGLSSHPPHPEGGGGVEPEYGGYDPSRSETDTDPFTESGRDAPAAPMVPTSIPLQPPTSAAAMHAVRGSASPRARTAGDAPPSTNAAHERDQPVQAPTTTSFYQQHGAATSLHSGELGYPRTTEGDQQYAPSEDSFEEEGYMVDEHGNPLRDLQGNLIPARRDPASEGSEEFDVIEQLQRDRMLGQSYGAEYGRYGSTSNGSGEYPQPDYSGSGYGRDWELPRHHHPTRLSDVPEEDERSRTSPSRASQRSRGLH